MINELPVLFENDFCIVFDKPSGLAVQGGKGIKRSLDSILEKTCSPKPFLVHRLDLDTSGIILTAKTKEAASAFSSLFGAFSLSPSGSYGKKKSLEKTYLAVSSGIPSHKEGLIKIPLEKKGRIQKSETFYRLLNSAFLLGMPCSFLELKPGSGRMHQIRRHLASLGHPVLGDDKYGDFSLNKKLKKTLKMNKLLLHSSRLSISAFPPFLPQGIEVEAPLPLYFKAVIEHFEQI